MDISFGAFELAPTLVLIRLATGFAFMGLFSSIESWIQDTYDHQPFVAVHVATNAEYRQP